MATASSDDLFSLPLIPRSRRSAPDIGRVTGRASRQHSPPLLPWLLLPVVFLLSWPTPSTSAGHRRHGRRLVPPHRGPALLYAAGFHVAILGCRSRILPAVLPLYEVPDDRAVHLRRDLLIVTSPGPALRHTSSLPSVGPVTTSRPSSPSSAPPSALPLFWQASQETGRNQSLPRSEALRREPRPGPRPVPPHPIRHLVE